MTTDELVTCWLDGCGPVDDRLAVAATIAAMDRCTDDADLLRLGLRLAAEDFSDGDRAELRAAYADYRRIVRMPHFRQWKETPVRRFRKKVRHEVPEDDTTASDEE